MLGLPIQCLSIYLSFNFSQLHFIVLHKGLFVIFFLDFLYNYVIENDTVSSLSFIIYNIYVIPNVQTSDFHFKISFFLLENSLFCVLKY